MPNRITKPDPHPGADGPAIGLARSLLADARFAALAVVDPQTGAPALSRIAIGLGADHLPLTLISSLSSHHATLRANPNCAFMVGEPGPKGDPLTHPRLMLQATAHFLDRDDPDHAMRRDHWLKRYPKSRLYVDFTDFTFVRFAVLTAFLNGGFGKAFQLSPRDLGQIQ